jgi:hypothetical protein
VVVQETDPWDVPLMVTRGYASLSFLHAAGKVIEACRKPTFLYYFGDYDPSGLDIPRVVEKRLREFAPYADVTFERVAVTPQQIEELSLPTRPTKKKDSRSKNFKGESVEVDAIPPHTLRELVRDCITRHIDQRAYEELKRIEQAERESLQNAVGSWLNPESS